MMAAWSLVTLYAGLTFSSALVEIAFVFALLFWVFEKWKTRDFSPPLPLGTIGFFLAFLLYAVLTVIWAENRELAAQGILKVTQQGAIFWMVADTFRDPRRWKLFVIAFAVVAAIVSCNAFYQFFTGRDFIRGFSGEEASSGLRVTGSFKSYGQLAAYLITSVPLVVAFAAGAIKERRFMLFAGYSVIVSSGLILVFLTRSRGAMLALVAGGIFFLILRRYWKILFVFLLLSAAAFMALPRSMVIHLDAEGKEQSLVERYYLWRRAADVIQAKPLGGTGINTYAETHQKYDRLQNWRVKRYYAHNGFLQMAAEIGIPGVLAFILFLLSLVRFVLRQLKVQGSRDALIWGFGCLIGISNFLLFACVDTVLHNPLPAMLFWFHLGLLPAGLGAASRSA